MRAKIIIKPFRTRIDHAPGLKFLKFTYVCKDPDTLLLDTVRVTPKYIITVSLLVGLMVEKRRIIVELGGVLYIT